jgi:hypothetical protein
MTGFIEHSQVVTTNNYNTLKITVTIAHKMNSSNVTLNLQRVVSNSSSRVLLKLLNSQFQFSNNSLDAHGSLIQFYTPILYNLLVWVLCYDRRFSRPVSWNKAPIWGLRPDFYYCHLRDCWFGALPLTRGRVCRLQLLLALASAVILGSESSGTRDHILLSDSTLLFLSPPTTTPSILVACCNAACLQFRCLALDVCYCCHALKREGVYQAVA